MYSWIQLNYVYFSLVFIHSGSLYAIEKVKITENNFYNYSHLVLVLTLLLPQYFKIIYFQKVYCISNKILINIIII